MYAAVKDGYLVLFEKDFKRNFVHVRDVADCVLHVMGNAAAMVGNVSIYHLVFIVSLLVAPLVLLMRVNKANKIDTKTLPLGE